MLSCVAPSRADFLLLRRCREKAARTAIARVRRPNVNPTASGTMFDFDPGVVASVLVGVLEGSADASLARRKLYNRRGSDGRREELDIAPLFRRFIGN